MSDPMKAMLATLGRRVGGCVLLCASSVAVAQGPAEVYVSTGEHGEISFSDVAVPGAERVNLPAPGPVIDTHAEMQRRIEQTLSVADALEESRLAREKARADARAAAAAARAQPATQVQPVAQGIYPGRYANYPHGVTGSFDHRATWRDKRTHGKGGHWSDRRWDGGGRARGERHRAPRTISKPFPYDPD